ncbi:phosphatase PAP2 family protein [Chryseobacterium chendengshani]|uniref:phosphatase PAP2 family protein n=1 Tax=unclassified Chryseobacterium TaxID=2593645 RepID=UPI001C63C76F|nr:MULTISPECIES: phosphatase PAP2 family protein [unclassified Chryseobacterium]MBW7674430.1 phosphatase PAP2 family protein [Chryseobacterium sp. LJ756]MBW8522782.1 phosphatase PAP2 family protein [Chryseobacterium sp. LJ668]QYK16314.1 phosphatase PAP2 family protein [Chryseobacterium sp. LJ668]
MEEKKASLLQTVSRIISDFFNPLVSLFIYFVYFSIQNYTFKEAFTHFLPILLITILPVISWIIWNVKTGRYTNIDVSNRVQRKSLYIFIAVCIVSYIIFNFIRNGFIDFVMLFILILLFALQFSNLYIKSSMHTAFNVFVATLFFAFDVEIGFVWLAIAVLVGITRVILKRHTVKEVFMGAGIAFLVSFIYLYCNNKYQRNDLPTEVPVETTIN